MMLSSIDIEILHYLAAKQGIGTQLEMDFNEPIYVFVNPEYLVDVPECVIMYSAKHEREGSYSSVDHPSFTRTRKSLANQGYISIENKWINGDRVIKPFYFNNVLMEVGSPFYCAAAMGSSIYKDEYNNGMPFTYDNVGKRIDTEECLTLLDNK